MQNDVCAEFNTKMLFVNTVVNSSVRGGKLHCALLKSHFKMSIDDFVACNLHKCDVETSNLQRTYTENSMYVCMYCNFKKF